MNAKAKGYVLGAIAAATYGMNPLFALPLYKAGMNPDSIPENHYPEKLLNLTVLFYDLHKSNYSTPS